MRRGRCPPCKKTFTVLPVWSPPSGHYSYECRRLACDAVAKGKSAPHCRDWTRLPDDSTLRRWARGKFISVLCGLVLSVWSVRQTFSAPPPSLPGIFRRSVVFCAWRPTHHECPRRRRVTQAADSVVGLPG